MSSVRKGALLFVSLWLTHRFFSTGRILVFWAEKGGLGVPPPVVALIMGKNGGKMDFGYGKTFLEKVSWGGPETPFCGISGPIPACGGVYTEKWTKF